MKALGLWYQPGSNQRHTDFQSVALPTELWYLRFWSRKGNIFSFYRKNILRHFLQLFIISTFAAT